MAVAQGIPWEKAFRPALGKHLVTPRLKSKHVYSPVATTDV